MGSLSSFYKSTVGMKAAMAVTGLILVGFVTMHMLDNLQIFMGAEAINGFAAGLREHMILLWTARLVLLASVLVHIYSAVILTLRSRAARPQPYVKREDQAATFASRTIVYGGTILVLYIILHLMHFTFGSIHPSFKQGDVYDNVVTGFSSLPVVLLYVAANLVLGLHLYHGAYALTRSLGFTDPRFTRAARALATGLAFVVAGGNVLIPILVYLRIGIA